MTNHLIGIVLADGEIFSNLSFTQHLYDVLAQGNHIKTATPIPVDATLQAARSLIPVLLKEDAVTVHQTLQYRYQRSSRLQRGVDRDRRCRLNMVALR